LLPAGRDASLTPGKSVLDSCDDMLWIIIGVLAVLAAGSLFVSLRHRPGAQSVRAEHDLEVFRAQLKELEREVEAGLIAVGEAEAARTEIKRRMLRADAARAAGPGTDGRGARVVTATVVALAVPAAALGLYLALGQPGTPSVPFAERAKAPAAGADTLPDVETMVARLEQRLAENPDDLRGWLVLGRSSFVLGRFERAVEAYDRALELGGDEAALQSAKGEALVMAAEGTVSEAARAAFERSLALGSKDPRASFYLAMAKEQVGDMRGALDDLGALLRAAPADAPWFGEVRQHAAQLAANLDVDPDTVLPPAREEATSARGGGPSAEDAQAAARMSDEERLATIRGMVGNLAARLEETPDDLTGWRMLARSYSILGESEKAVAAFRRVLALDESDQDALFFLGDAARQEGDAAAAAAYWRRLLAQLAPGTQDYADMENRIEALDLAD